MKAAPPRLYHVAIFFSYVLFVSLEYEFGDFIRILSLKVLSGSSKDSIRLHSAYSAIPAWLSLKAVEVAIEFGS